MVRVRNNYVKKTSVIEDLRIRLYINENFRTHDDYIL